MSGISKAQWPKGPWTDEPDLLKFEHLGFPCIIARQMRSGHLCGYVAVPPGHPWHGKDEDQIGASAHGGLTYAAKCAGDICHVAKPGEPDDVWWLGFDCAHLGDLDHFTREDPSAGRRARAHDGDTYKDVAYVRGEIESLAKQAQEAK